MIIEENGKAGFEWYRVPGLVTTAAGTVLLSYEGRTKEQNRRVLFIRRSEDGGRTFLSREIIAEPRENELLHNPMLLAGKDGQVWIFWCQDYGHLFMRKSSDDGRTFGTIRELTSYIDGFREKWPVTLWSISPGHGIETKEGALVLPVWLSCGENAHLPACFASLFSEDKGNTWRCSNVIKACGDMGDPTEASIAQSQDGRLLATMRHEKPLIRKRAFCRGKNAGEWETPWTSDAIPDPVCSGALLTLKDGRMAFVNCANADEKAVEKQLNGENIRWSEDARKNLTVRVSEDMGQSWSDGLQIEAEGGAADLSQCMEDETVLCFYEKGWTDGNSIFNRYLALKRLNI